MSDLMSLMKGQRRLQKRMWQPKSERTLIQPFMTYEGVTRRRDTYIRASGSGISISKRYTMCLEQKTKSNFQINLSRDTKSKVV